SPRLAAETPAARGPSEPGGGADVFVPEVRTATIARGDSLWEISRRTYGAGDRYSVIYDANQDQIRDPDLIYPGQIFVLPSEGAPEAGPAGERG
ncbi:LysM peptidoglycan-binding domain-containing protein, partial [Methylobacterium sp. WL122]